MGNGINRIGNTAAIPIRMGGTVVTTTADLANTLLYNLPKEGLEVLGNTTQQIKDVLLGAWNHGKWYHKAMNIPLSPIIAGGTAFEGVVRAVVQPVINGVVNTRNTGKNFFTNTFRNLGRTLSKKPISDFSYDHVKTRPLTLNNWFAKLQLKKGQASRGGDKKETTVVAPIVAQNKEEKKDSETKEKTEEEKPDKKDKKTEDKSDKETPKETPKTEGNIEKNKIEEGYKTAEEILKDSKHGTKVYANVRANNPNLTFDFDKSSSTGEIEAKTEKIIVGLNMPSDERQIAPLNYKKNSKEQTKHVLLHEIGHIMVGSNEGNKKIEKALKLAKGFFEKDKTTISPIAQLDIYKTDESKAKEDIVEMLALYMNKNEDLDKYLSKISSDKKEDEEYRKKFKLSKISKEDVSTIKDACVELVKAYS